MGEWDNKKPLTLHMGVSIVQITIMVILAIMAALDTTDPQPSISPINGNWSNWIDNTSCSVTCGGGFKMQLRSCDKPDPANGGKSCPGSSSQIVVCNTNSCPVNGAWSLWLYNTTCSTSCGGGFQTKFRSCDSPPPAYGGNKCVGPDAINLTCNTQHCPVDGNWNAWTEDFPCSVSCGGGLHVQVRTCSDPTPMFCGQLCPENSSFVEECNTQPCPINGGWGQWADDKPCSVSCGGGTRTRIRSCDDPVPQYGGLPCPGSGQLSLPCNTSPCPNVVDGQWGPWVNKTSCSNKIVNGTLVQERVCNSPARNGCGKLCQGSSSQLVPCKVCSSPSFLKSDMSLVCIITYSDRLAYKDAQKKCQSVGARLPEIKSPADNEIFRVLTTPDSSYWDGTFIGLDYLLNKNVFVWNSDQSVATYQNWNPGEPNELTLPDGDCTILINNGLWGDLSCAWKFKYMCELVI